MKISLDQWHAFITVVETGGYAKAAERLNKSQSTLSYAIQKIEGELEIRLFKLEGRKATLTDAGEALVTPVRDLLKRAENTEFRASQFSAGVRPRIRLAVDALFPVSVLMELLTQFQKAHPETQIDLHQTVLSGTDQALLEGTADLVIGGRIPVGFSGLPLYRERFIAVAGLQHPLHALERPLTLDDLRNCRQLVVRDSGQRNIDAGWLGAHQRWTVNSLTLSIDAAEAGLGFAWLPQMNIQDRLDRGTLKPLNLESGSERFEQLYLIATDSLMHVQEIKTLHQLIMERAERLSSGAKTEN